MISDSKSQDIPTQMKFLSIVFPILLQSHLKLECCKPHKAAHHLTKCDVIYDIKQFPSVYSRIYCRKFYDVIQSGVGIEKQVH